MKASQIYRIVIIALILISCVYYYIRFHVKPINKFKSYESSKILYTDTFRQVIGVLVSIAIITALYLSKRVDGFSLTAGFIGGLIGVLVSKSSCLIISESKVYVKRTIIELKDIKQIYLHRKELTIPKYCNIIFQNGTGYDTYFSKKSIKFLKIICVKNDIEFKE